MTQTGPTAACRDPVLDIKRKADRRATLDPGAQGLDSWPMARVARFKKVKPSGNANKDNIRQGEALSQQPGALADHRLQLIMPVLDRFAAEAA